MPTVATGALPMLVCEKTADDLQKNAVANEPNQLITKKNDPIVMNQRSNKYDVSFQNTL